MSINFVKSRRGSKDNVLPGDVVNQTLSLENRSDYDITNIYIKDTLVGATFNNRSVQIEGTSYPDANPINGFNMPINIRAQSSATVTYSITILDSPPERITAVSTITYTADGETYTEDSSTYTMMLDNGELSVTKECDRDIAIVGSEITYTIAIQNLGTVKNTSIVFKDSIPSGTSFIEDSVTINGVTKTGYDPSVGFSLDNLDPGSKTIVSFKVKII